MAGNRSRTLILCAHSHYTAFQIFGTHPMSRSPKNSYLWYYGSSLGESTCRDPKYTLDSQRVLKLITKVLKRFGPCILLIRYTLLDEHLAAFIESGRTCSPSPSPTGRLGSILSHTRPLRFFQLVVLAARTDSMGIPPRGGMCPFRTISLFTCTARIHSKSLITAPAATNLQ